MSGNWAWKILAGGVAMTAMGMPAAADVREVVERHILPGFAEFDAAAQDLASRAADDCSATALQAPWNVAFDAWLKVQHYHIGPSEAGGRALTIAYWPDPKNLGARQMAAMLEAEDPDLTAEGGMAQVSIAARGLYGIERILHGETYAQGDYACDLVRAMTADLATTSAGLAQDWVEYAPLLTTAGEAGNSTYRSADEARQALFTQLLAGIEFNEGTRLARPLGTFDAPRPERAEALLAHRAKRNLALSMQALGGLAEDLAQIEGKSDGAPVTKTAFERVEELLGKMDDPDFAGVADPSGRLKVEILQQAIIAAGDAAEAEIGLTLGVSAGFNSADGD
jgi:predicted lipoprotein